MSNIQFKCGQCGNLMAVGSNLLGKQVRCPHCRQVVLAPASMPTVPAPVAENKPTEPLFETPARTDHDSIFTPTEKVSEDLFGAPPQQPPIEMPGGAWPNLQVEGTTATVPPSPALTQDPQNMPEVVPHLHEGVSPDVAATTFQDSEQLSTPGLESAASEEGVPVEERAVESVHAGRTLPTQTGKGSSMFLLFLLIILIPYSLIATAAAIFYFYQYQGIKDYSPLETLPDAGGENPGATRKEKQTSVITEREVPENRLSAKLRVPLGQKIQIGDLEAFPRGVERRKIVCCYENSNEQSESPQDALVLTLELRNTSIDDYFAPTDPAFYSAWSKDLAAFNTRPYTFLQVGDANFFGGAAESRAQTRSESKSPQYILGQDFRKELNPGEKMTTIVCTDPENPEILEAVDHCKETLVWRVLLRRGLVAVRNGEVSACAVIGVEFTSKDIVQK